jgi:hypothetical protein
MAFGGHYGTGSQSGVGDSRMVHPGHFEQMVSGSSGFSVVYGYDANVGIG